MHKSGEVQRRDRHSHPIPPPPVLCINRSLKTLGMPVKITPRLLLKCKDLENLQLSAASNSSFFPPDYDPMRSLQLYPGEGGRNCAGTSYILLLLLADNRMLPSNCQPPLPRAPCESISPGLSRVKSTTFSGAVMSYGYMHP